MDEPGVLGDALDGLLRQVDLALRPDAAAVHEAKRRASALIDELHRGRAWMFNVVEVREHGSLSRGTAIRGFRDIDYLVVLDPEALATQRGAERSPRDTITRMADSIRQRRAGLVRIGGMNVRAQDHSVGVLYPQAHFRIDLVPAVRDRHALRVPERGSDRWIHSDPEQSRVLLESARRRNPHVGIAVRLLKGWRRARGSRVPLPSFALETLLVAAGNGESTTLPDLVQGFFSRIARAHAGRRLALLGADGRAVSVIDPVSGANLATEMTATHRANLIQACRDAEGTVEEVAELVERRRLDRAMSKAMALFAKE